MKNLNEREKTILTLLEKTPSVSVSSLTKLLFASEATVRRDLKRLEEKGLILRSHGKAVSARQYTGNTAFDTRMALANTAKNRIARAAVEKCVDTGAVIMLDASSTVAYAVEYLSEKKVTAITSGIQTLSLLAKTDLDFYSTGGKAVKGSYSLVGQSAIDFIAGFNADICMVSCHGLTPEGYVCDTSETELEVRRAMMKNSKISILLADSSKFNKTYIKNLCHISEFDYVFSDAPLPQSICEKIKNVYVIEDEKLI